MAELKFRKSFDEALQQAYLFHTGFNVDKTSFTGFSTMFADPFAANFLTDIQTADNLPTYEDDLADLGLLTQAVDEALETGRVHFQKLMFFVRNIWPNNDAVYAKFGGPEYDKVRDNQLKFMNLMQTAYKAANSSAYKSQLIAAGFLQTDIDLFDTIYNDIVDKNNAQEDFKRDTYLRTQTKIEAFNKMWDSMVKISEASKIIFKNNPAKVEYYLLYPEKPIPIPPAAPQNFSYATDTHVFSWDAVETATSYQLQEKLSSDMDWTVVMEVSETSVTHNVPPGDWQFRVRARNAGGFGDFSAVLDVTIALDTPNIYNISYNSGTDSILVQWNPVIWADKYEVWSSNVPIGFPPGSYSKLAEPVSPEYITNNPTHTRTYYYYVIAKYGSISSGQSNVVSVNVPT